MLHRLMLLFGIFLAIYVHQALAGEYTNPLKKDRGGDPNIVYDDGWYYFMSTSGPPPALRMKRARTLKGLKTADIRVVYTDSDPSRAFNLWAPEMHKLDDVWYIYYTAGPKKCCDLQRGHVIKGGKSLWDEFEYLGQIRDDYSVDGTLLSVNGKNYYVYSCHDTSNNNTQSLCIAPRTGPATTGESTVISSPTEEWESQNSPLNEGPYALYYRGDTWLSFSAGTCDSPTYSVGLLHYTGGDPMRKSSWHKKGPVFSAANGQYGTGHNSFFASPDGTELWNSYHSVTNPNGSCGDDRMSSALRVRFTEDGTPDLGMPLPLEEVLQGPSGEGDFDYIDN